MRELKKLTFIGCSKLNPTYATMRNHSTFTFGISSIVLRFVGIHFQVGFRFPFTDEFGFQ